MSPTLRDCLFFILTLPCVLSQGLSNQNHHDPYNGLLMTRTPPYHNNLPQSITDTKSESQNTKRQYSVEKNPMTGKYELVITERSLKPFTEAKDKRNGNGLEMLRPNPAGKDIDLVDPSTGKYIGKLSYTDAQNIRVTNEGSRTPSLNKLKLPNGDYRFIRTSEFAHDNPGNTRVKIVPGNDKAKTSDTNIPTKTPDTLIIPFVVKPTAGQTPNLKSSVDVGDIVAYLERKEKMGSNQDRNDIGLFSGTQQAALPLVSPARLRQNNPHRRRPQQFPYLVKNVNDILKYANNKNMQTNSQVGHRDGRRGVLNNKKTLNPKLHNWNSALYSVRHLLKDPKQVRLVPTNNVIRPKTPRYRHAMRPAYQWVG